MPFFTVILSKLILGQSQSMAVYCSLIPIISGVIIATVTEISFDMVGLVAALSSTIVFALQNIYTKKVSALTTQNSIDLRHSPLRVQVNGRMKILLTPTTLELSCPHDPTGDARPTGAPSPAAAYFSSIGTAVLFTHLDFLRCSETAPQSRADQTHRVSHRGAPIRRWISELRSKPCSVYDAEHVVSVDLFGLQRNEADLHHQ